MEFQSKGSPGNKPHVHGGVTLHPGESDEQKASRITAKAEEMMCGMTGLDLDSCLRKGSYYKQIEFNQQHVNSGII